MFIDKTSQINRYDYSLIQYLNPLTDERFNLGVALKYEDELMLHLNKISKSVANCLDIGELNSLNHTLSVIKERIADGELHIGNVSNVLKISELHAYESELNVDDAFAHIIKEFISIKKLREEKKNSVHTSRFGKMSIIRGLKSIKKDKNLIYHKHIEGMANIVDILYLKEKKPVAVAQVTSPHIKDFYEKIASSILTLEEFKKIDTIKERIVYAPILTNISNADKMKLYQAQEAAKERNIEVITKHDNKAIIERLTA